MTRRSIRIVASMVVVLLLVPLLPGSGNSRAAAGVAPGQAGGVPPVAEASDPEPAASGDQGETSAVPDAPGVDASWWGAVQEEIRQAEYHVTWDEHPALPNLPAAYQAPNRAHNLRTYFTAAGPVVVRRTAAHGEAAPWRWSISLGAWGWPGALESPGTPTLEPLANRLEYRYPAEMVAWYLNDAAGLEQGFTVSLPLSSSGDSGDDLVLDLLLTTDLLPEADPDGQSITFSTLEGAPVLRYGAPQAHDAEGRALAIGLEQVAGDGEPGVVSDDALSSAGSQTHLRLTVETSAAAWPVTIEASITGLSSEADWFAEGDVAGAEFGQSVSTAGDVNGDDYSDVIVGAPHYDNGQEDEGAVFAFYGSDSGLSASPDWQIESNEAGAQFGYSVSTAGDVNGDYYCDVIVGSPYHTDGQDGEGGVWVYYGSWQGLFGTQPDYLQRNLVGAHFGYAVAYAGDVNDDSYADVMAGAPDYQSGEAGEGAVWVWHGSESGLESTPDWQAESNQSEARLGHALSTAGDVNRDGHADVIVGAPNYYVSGEFGGAALVWHGTDDGLNEGVDGHPGNAEIVLGYRLFGSFGRAVSTAGDVNGDGYSDVVVGAPDYTAWLTWQGAAYVYHGSSSGLIGQPERILMGWQDLSYYGAAVSTAGDVNGDGYADIAIGWPFYDGFESGQGQVEVYYGSESGIGSPANWFGWFPEDGQQDAHLGVSVATAGDVNGDGFSDLIAGANLYDGLEEDEGAAVVFYGSAETIADSAGWTKRSNLGNSEFGYSVGTAGDVNGDGYADVIVGAAYWDGGGGEEGSAWVYCGSKDGPHSAPDWHKTGDQAGAHFGWSVGRAGDVNGDGYDDVIVGAPYWDGSQDAEGGAWVYHGSSLGLGSAPAWFKSSGQASAQFGISVGTAGDVNGDGYADVIVGARNYNAGVASGGWAGVYFGSGEGLDIVPGWHVFNTRAGAHFGFSVATAGDVNRDGYSDIVVGAPDWAAGETGEGAAFVYHGSADGPSAHSDWYKPSDRTDVHFGYSVGTAGDVNGDGYADVIVGAPFWDSPEADEGEAFIYHGSSGGLSSSPAWHKQSDQNQAHFGWSVGTAGDVNGDGCADVVVGAPGWDGTYTNEGQAFLYHGSTGGVLLAPASHPNGSSEGALLGTSVGTAGDVNGDGYADVILGAPRDTDVVADEGRAFVYYGNHGPCLRLRPRQLDSDMWTPLAHLGMSDSPEGFGLAAVVRNPFGTGRSRLEAEVKSLFQPFDRLYLSILSDWALNYPGGYLSSTIVGGSADTAYHWRLRWRYSPATTPYLPASRWFTIPWNGWNEEDLRTPVEKGSPRRILLPLVRRGY